ncbi:MAG: MBL fold metallo-hydrolase [Nitrososphaeria archaeon]
MTVHLGDSLIKMIDDRTGFFNLRTKIDLILGEGREAIIVDSGIDGDVGRRVIRALEEDNLVLKHIVLTHVYADHFGGAWFLKKSWGFGDCA